MGVSAVVLNVTVTDTSGAGYLTVYPTGGVYPSGQTRPTASSLNWSPHQTVTNLVEVGVGSGGYVDIYAFGSSAAVIFDVQGWVGTPANSGGSDGLFNSVPPSRILDTRDGTGTGGFIHPLGVGSSLTLQVAGGGTNHGYPSGVPAAGVSAVVLNLTVSGATRSSYVTVYPAGAGRPVASNLNFTAGQTVANRVIVKLGASGAVTIYNAAGTVNVSADVNGWFTDSTSIAGGTDFTAISPSRFLDTRSASWGLGPLCSGCIYSIQLLDANGRPLTGISAVVVNVTATDTTAAGYLTLWPDNGTPQPYPPDVSDLNFLPGQTVPNLVVLQLGAQSTFDILNPEGNTDVVIDVVGFYGTQDAALAAATVVAHAQTRPFGLTPSH